MSRARTVPSAEGAAARGRWRPRRSRSRCSCPGTRSRLRARRARPGQRQRARRVHVRRGGDPARRRRGPVPRVGALAPEGLPPARRRRRRDHAGRRLGRAAAPLAAVRPARHPADMGIQWGMFGALLAAGALIAAGAARARAARARSRRTRPPTTSTGSRRRTRERERTPDRRPRDATAVTELLRERPAWEGEPPDPSRAETTRLPSLGPRREAPTRRERRPGRGDRRSVSGTTSGA